MEAPFLVDKIKCHKKDCCAILEMLENTRKGICYDTGNYRSYKKNDNRS